MYSNRNNNMLVLSLYLKDYSKKFYLREISRLTKVPLKNTYVILNELEKDNIIKSQLVGKNKYFYLNLDNIEVKYLILNSEIYKTVIFIKKYPHFTGFLKELDDPEACIVIFGSFAKFSVDKDSDLDLLIISDKKIEIPYHVIPNKIHEIILSKNDFIETVEKNEIFIKKIKENHIILDNHSFFVNVIWRKYAK